MTQTNINKNNDNKNKSTHSGHLRQKWYIKLVNTNKICLANKLKKKKIILNYRIN